MQQVCTTQEVIRLPLCVLHPSIVQVGRLGIGICYDIRFQEMAMLYAARGVQLIVYPGERVLCGWPRIACVQFVGLVLLQGAD